MLQIFCLQYNLKAGMDQLQTSDKDRWWIVEVQFSLNLAY